MALIYGTMLWYSEYHYGTNGPMLPWYVLQYVHVYVRTMVRTNITLSQKRLEIQALGVVSIEDITVYYS
jgi:hypothetical protein